MEKENEKGEPKCNEGSVQSPGIQDQTESEVEVEGNADLGAAQSTGVYDQIESEIEGNAGLGLQNKDVLESKLRGSSSSRDNVMKRIESMDLGTNKTRKYDGTIKVGGRGSGSTDNLSSMRRSDQELVGIGNNRKQGLKRTKSMMDLGSNKRIHLGWSGCYQRIDDGTDAVGDGNSSTGVEEDQAGEGNEANNPLQQNRALEEMKQSLTETLMRLEAETHVTEVVTTTSPNRSTTTADAATGGADNDDDDDGETNRAKSGD